MSNISTVQRLRTSIKVQRTVSMGLRLFVALILIIFSIFPILWVVSASLNPTGSLATQKIIFDQLLGQCAATLDRASSFDIG